MGPLPWSAEQSARADSGAGERGIGPRPHGAASGTPAKAHERTARRDRASARSRCAELRAVTDHVAQGGNDIAGAGSSAAVSACVALVDMRR